MCQTNHGIDKLIKSTITLQKDTGIIMLKSLLTGFVTLLLSSITPTYAAHHEHGKTDPTVDNILIEEARINSVVSGMINSAGYMHINNNTARDLTLIQAKSNIAKRVELHEHVTTDGLMRMQKVDGITIPSKQSVMLKPGGYHIMFLGLQQPLNENDTAQITLLFSDGSTKSIMAVIKKPQTVIRQHNH